VGHLCITHEQARGQIKTANSGQLSSTNRGKMIEILIFAIEAAARKYFYFFIPNRILTDNQLNDWHVLQALEELINEQKLSAHQKKANPIP
jgi:hypothetical protein